MRRKLQGWKSHRDFYRNCCSVDTRLLEEDEEVLEQSSALETSNDTLGSTTVTSTEGSRDQPSVWALGQYMAWMSPDTVPELR